MDADTSHWRIEELLGESSWLSALARELVSDRALADDVAQETWAAALRTPPPRATPLRPWLARVARNFAKQHARSETRRARREVEHASDVDTSSPGAGELSARLEGQRLLVAALGELNEPYRSTVLLVYFEHQTSAQIAERDGVAESTVRWRLKQALDELRTRLDARAHGDRRQWALALAPLARSTPSVPVVATPTLFAGVLAMSLIWKLALIGAATAVLVIGMTWNRGDDTASDTAIASVVTQPAELAADATSASAPGEVDAQPAREVASSSVSATQRVARTQKDIVKLRFLDSARAPLAGVTVREVVRPSDGLGAWTRDAHVPAAGVSATDGRAQLDITHSEAHGSFTKLRVELDGFATIFVDTGDRPNFPLDLGDRTLVPGGSIRGSVHDTAGAPISGAVVGVCSRRDVAMRRERARRAPASVLDDLQLRTDAAGNFTLSGVPIGHAILGAERSSFLSAFSEPIEVRAGSVTVGVELVLEPVPAGEIVDGVVVRPDGAPLAGARVEYRIGDPLGDGGTRDADEHGRFSFVLAHGERLDLDVEDPDHKLAAARLHGILGGARGLELRLGTVRSLVLEVRDARGVSVASFRASAVPVGMRDAYLEEHTGGRAEFVVPAQPFTIEVEADGFRRWSSGVLDSDNVAPLVTAVLDRMPQLTGRVLAVTGVVELGGTHVVAAKLATQRCTVNGFPSRVDPDDLGAGTTRPDGSFALTVRERARIILRCSREGYSATELGPFDYDPEVGLTGAEVHLTRGGAIEGRVLVPEGASAAGLVVGFSRGDARAFSLRAKDDGSFLVQGLTPGPWQVVRLDAELSRWGLLISNTDSAPYTEIPTSCIVLDGQTIHCDVPFVAPARAHVVEGTLTIDGAPAAGWTAALFGDDTPGGAEGEQTIDAAGHFSLGVSTPGRTLFRFGGIGGTLGGVNFMARVEVTDAQTLWSTDLREASIVLDVASANDEPMPRVLVITIQPGVHAFLLVSPTAGEHRLTIPAGRAKLAHFPADDSESDPDKWPALAEVTIAPGATATLKVP